MKEKKKHNKLYEEQEQNQLSEEAVAYELKGKRPCQFTVEELKEEIRQSLEDVKAGRVYTWEEIKSEMDTWLK